MELAAAHAVVVALSNEQVRPALILEVLDELRDVGRCDSHLAVQRMAPLARRDDGYLIRYIHGRRHVREELNQRESLLVITLLRAHILMIPHAARLIRCSARCRC